MRWIDNLPVRLKLLGAFLLMLVLPAIVAANGQAAILSIQRSQRSLVDRDFQLAVDLVELRADLNRQRARLLEMMLERDVSQRRALGAEIKQRAGEIDALM